MANSAVFGPESSRGVDSRRRLGPSPQSTSHISFLQAFCATRVTHPLSITRPGALVARTVGAWGSNVVWWRASARWAWCWSLAWVSGRPAVATARRRALRARSAMRRRRAPAATSAAWTLGKRAASVSRLVSAPSERTVKALEAPRTASRSAAVARASWPSRASVETRATAEATPASAWIPKTAWAAVPVASAGTAPWAEQADRAPVLGEAAAALERLAGRAAARRPARGESAPRVASAARAVVAQVARARAPPVPPVCPLVVPRGKVLAEQGG